MEILGKQMKSKEQKKSKKTKKVKKGRIFKRIFLAILVIILVLAIVFIYKIQINGGGVSGIITTIVGSSKEKIAELDDIYIMYGEKLRINRYNYSC